MNKQFNYIQTKNLGYNHASTIAIPLRTLDLRHRAGILKKSLFRNPVIQSASLVSNIPGYFGSRTTFKVSDSDNEPILLTAVATDNDIINTLQLKLEDGNNFNDQFKSGLFIPNETAVKVLGLNKPVGTVIESGWNGLTGTIVGVVKDFHFHRHLAR